MNENYIIEDGEMEQVTGGVRAASKENGEVVAYCPNCKKHTSFTPISGARGKCHVCGKIAEI